VAGGAESGASAAAEKQVAFSFTTNLLNNRPAADALADLFRSVYTALDDDKITYLQGTLTMLVETSLVEKIRDKAAEAGITANVKDL
jgi:hypothetical protein